MPLRMRDSRPHAKTKLPFLGSMFVSFLAISTNSLRNGSEVVFCAHMPKAVWTKLITLGESISRRIRRFRFSVVAFPSAQSGLSFVRRRERR